VCGGGGHGFSITPFSTSKALSDSTTISLSCSFERHSGTSNCSISATDPTFQSSSAASIAALALTLRGFFSRLCRSTASSITSIAGRPFTGSRLIGAGIRSSEQSPVNAYCDFESRV
jgi:hypothetical protein